MTTTPTGGPGRATSDSDSVECAFRYSEGYISLLKSCSDRAGDPFLRTKLRRMAEAVEDAQHEHIVLGAIPYLHAAEDRAAEAAS